MSNITKGNHTLPYYFSILLGGAFVLMCFAKLVGYFTYSYDYKSFEISDWLINYEGGFVRRGVMGEIIYILYTYIPFSVKTAIGIIDCFTFIAIFALLIKTCNYLKTSIFPFLTVYCGAITTVGWYRRDFLVLLLVYFAFCFYMKYIKNGKFFDFSMSQIIMTVTILIHESSFFFLIPILFVINWFHSSGKLISKQKLMSSLKSFSIPLLAMAIVSVMKGDSEKAAIIWKSWSPLFTMYPEDTFPEMGDGVLWLLNDMKYAAEFHLGRNFQTNLGILYIIKCIIMLCITLMLTYYITLRCPQIDFKNKTLNVYKHNINIANILLLQFLFMTPMFTVLSVDYARTILYCVVSAVFAAYAMKKNDINIHYPIHCKNYSLYMYKYIEKSKLLVNPWVYFLIIILYPINKWHYISVPDDIFIYKILSTFFNAL